MQHNRNYYDMEKNGQALCDQAKAVMVKKEQEAIAAPEPEKDADVPVSTTTEESIFAAKTTTTIKTGSADVAEANAS